MRFFDAIRASWLSCKKTILQNSGVERLRRDPEKHLMGHGSSRGSSETAAADEIVRNNCHALDTGGALLVTMGDIPSLVRLQAQASWEKPVD